MQTPLSSDRSLYLPSRKRIKSMPIITGNVVVIDRRFRVYPFPHMSNFVELRRTLSIFRFLELPLVTAILHIFAYDVA